LDRRSGRRGPHPGGPRVITKAKAYLNDPATRSKIADLRGKITLKTTR